MSNDPFNRDSLFFENLPGNFEVGDDAAQTRLLREYGAVFVARGGVVAPRKVVFRDEDDVSNFQAGLEMMRAELGGFSLELQRVAMERLLTAVDQASDAGLSITPRGADSARRNYEGTIELWKSRVEPALVHWIGKDRITVEKADEIRRLSPYDQVPEIFALEEDGIFFAKDLSKSIIYSVAPPGASQHLSLLAFDVAEFDDATVREILAQNYWYQTVTSDLPHFTFLGVEEHELGGLGLKSVSSGGREFWLPDI